MKKLNFYKKLGRWYIDLPDWTGDISDLEMVEGADDMLDFMAQHDKKITLYVSDEYFEGSDLLSLSYICKDGGAHYKLKTYEGIDIDVNIWLCDVTKFIFGDFKDFYIKNLNF